GYGQNYQNQGYGQYNREPYGPGYQQPYNRPYQQQPYTQQAGGGRMKKTKKKRRKILFVVELLILLILAVGVFAFTRIMRMEHVNLGEILTNEGAASQSGYQNIVLYGVDSREGNLTQDA